MPEKLKVLFVSFIVFFGTAFAIMTFNEDVSVDDMFDKIYHLTYDDTMTSNGVLEFFYAVGAASGILIFYNHFGSKNMTTDPTPLEIKMWQYDKDVTEYKEENKKRQNVAESENSK